MMSMDVSSPKVRTQPVLGIDAAWTNTQPSGVALAMRDAAGWRLTALAPSYLAFHALARDERATKSRPTGSEPNARCLLASAKALCGAPPDLVAIDMPLSHEPIVGRRASDDAVSKAYGARHCSTHSPSATRPGKISDDLKQAFDAACYPLLTSAPATRFGLVEVYPHPALVEFTHAPMRLKYKVSKARKYWPDQPPPERRNLLLKEWARIIDMLDSRLPGVKAALPPPCDTATATHLKAHEDMLDAVVCACAAICVLEDIALPYGDDTSAIWIPQPQGPTPP